MPKSNNTKPVLAIIVPSLREPEFTRSLADYPAILRFLLRSRHESADLHSAEQAALYYFGYAPVNAKELPAGICCLLADTGERLTPIVRADPVYVKAEPDHASIHSAAALQLDEQDAQQLVTGLNSHFEQIGCRFHLGDSWRWYISGVEATTLMAEPLNQVADRNVVSFLDPERQPVEWRRLLTEIQMILHASPVNVERMERGQQPINSLWAWGGHPLPQRIATPNLHSYADDAFTNGLAQASEIECLPLTQSLAYRDDQSMMVCARFLETLLLQQSVASPGDFSTPEPVDPHATDLQGLNSQQGGLAWLDKTLAWGMSKLARGRFSEIHLVPCDGEVLRMRRVDLLRFWLRKR